RACPEPAEGEIERGFTSINPPLERGKKNKRAAERPKRWLSMREGECRMIEAGKVSDIFWSNGTWLILDIGFSGSQKTCGMLKGDGKAYKLKFHDAIEEVIKIAKDKPMLNLVIEAPLSVAFDKSGNPKRRKIDFNRPWYFNSGCTVMVATMYLMWKLCNHCPPVEVRLFEGFVSFKNKGAQSNHLGDVERLRDTIKHQETQNFYDPKKLAEDECDNVMSAFKLMNMDLGIPPVIKVDG
ncbi:MAG: hypothetical protein HY663_05600, partial [Chloroflexi bacterium]|nr:hypothetical protein [Chloroflexota bacterium]